MNKKFFIGLFLVSLVLLSGGCGGSSKSSTDSNTALSGAWSSSNDGTATVAYTAESDDVNALIKAFGISNEDLTKLKEASPDLYKLYEEVETSTETNVTRAMAVFESCDVSGTNGTAKLTAIIIISSDNSFWPIVFNGVTLKTQRSGNELTATVPNMGTLTMSLSSNEKMTLSGKIKYLGYDCEFSTVINKNPSNPVDPKTILSGTWNLSGDQGGGYLSDGSQIIATAAPETASIFFSGDSEPSVTSLYSLRMNTSSTESLNETSLLQNISDGNGTLTGMGNSVYKLTETNGSESIIFVENIDEIFVFMLESEDNYGQSCMFLPLKKVSVDIESALNKTWTATQGGGYVSASENEKLNELGAFSLSVKEATLNFSNVTSNDDGTVTATVKIDADFTFANKFLEDLGISTENISIPLKETWTGKMIRSGNFLQFTNDNDQDEVYKISFVSDKEAFLSVISDSDGVTGELVIKFISAE